MTKIMPKSKKSLNVEEILNYARKHISGRFETVNVHRALLNLLKNVIGVNGGSNSGDALGSAFNATIVYWIVSIHQDNLKLRKSGLPNKVKEIERQIETFKELYIDQNSATSE